MSVASLAKDDTCPAYTFIAATPDARDRRAGTLVAPAADRAPSQGPAAGAGDRHAIAALLHGDLAAGLADLEQAVDAGCELVALNGPQPPSVDRVILTLPPGEALSVTQVTFQTTPGRLELSLELTDSRRFLRFEIEKTKLVIVVLFPFLGGEVDVLERIPLRPDDRPKERQINRRTERRARRHPDLLEDGRTAQRAQVPPRQIAVVEGFREGEPPDRLPRVDAQQNVADDVVTLHLHHPLVRRRVRHETRQVEDRPLRRRINDGPAGGRELLAPAVAASRPVEIRSKRKGEQSALRRGEERRGMGQRKVGEIVDDSAIGGSYFRLHRVVCDDCSADLVIQAM